MKFFTPFSKSDVILITPANKIFLFIQKINNKIIPGLFFTVLFFSFSLAETHAQQTSHVSIMVNNIEKSAAFFKDVLSFTEAGNFALNNKEAQQLFGIKDPMLSVKGIKLKLGDEYIELMQFTSTVPGCQIPIDSKSNDLWFQHIAIVVSDIDSAYNILRKVNVTHVSTSPQTLPAYIPAAAGIKAFYFRDPDGHNLELIYFSPGKGNSKWQGQSNLFSGIDHTAIAVNETEKSLPFYTTLGFNVAGHSENYGTEQEHLNQVFGARLSITSLRGTKGFNVEFLDYTAPPGGRPYPKDTKPPDLVYWHISIQVNNLKEIYSSLQKLNHSIISKGIVSIDDGTGITRKMFLTRDTDGHFILLSD